MLGFAKTMNSLRTIKRCMHTHLNKSVQMTCLKCPLRLVIVASPNKNINFAIKESY